MSATKLQAARRQRDNYTQQQVVREPFALVCAQCAGHERVGLKGKLSRWENGHEQVSEPYRRLFRELYGRTNAELGFPSRRG